MITCLRFGQCAEYLAGSAPIGVCQIQGHHRLQEVWFLDAQRRDISASQEFVVYDETDNSLSCGQ